MTTTYDSVEGLLLANLRLVTLLSSEQYSQFERFRLQHDQLINKTSISRQHLLPIMPKRAELPAISFDV